MTKGRGSNLRRLGLRQRLAHVANIIGIDHPFAIEWEKHRDRQWRKRNPLNFIQEDHPLERPRMKRPVTWNQRMDRQNKAAAKQVAANAARQREWLS